MNYLTKLNKQWELKKIKKNKVNAPKETYKTYYNINKLALT